MRAAAAAALTALLCHAAYAQQLVPGEYVTDRGWGTLTVTRDAKGALAFAIESVGGNQHVCGLDGDIRGGRATLEAMDPGKPCVVTYTPKADGIDVTANDGRICNFFCGAHARFEGLYRKVAAPCLPKNVRDTRAAFKRAYDRREYAAAQKQL